MFDLIFEWFNSLDWTVFLPEFLGKACGVLIGLAISWYAILRRRLRAIERMQSGDSDDFIFQMHVLLPSQASQRSFPPAHQASDEAANQNADQTAFASIVNEGLSDQTHPCTLVFRNVAPKTTLNDLYDNPAVRKTVRELADRCSLSDPILRTEGPLGFELLNDALGHIAGLLAISPQPRSHWLFCMTCEDRQVVRKKCVRCFLIRPVDLMRFADWDWCRDFVRVEKPWHWFRVVALHRIAVEYQQQCDRGSVPSVENSPAGEANRMPLVQEHQSHDRIRSVSLGIHQDEVLVGKPSTIDWEIQLPKLAELGLVLSAEAKQDAGSPGGVSEGALRT